MKKFQSREKKGSLKKKNIYRVHVDRRTNIRHTYTQTHKFTNPNAQTMKHHRLRQRWCTIYTCIYFQRATCPPIVEEKGGRSTTAHNLRYSCDIYASVMVCHWAIAGQLYASRNMVPFMTVINYIFQKKKIVEINPALFLVVERAHFTGELPFK